MTESWLRSIAALLRDKNVDIETILDKLSSTITTSSMFTSLTSHTALTWAERKEHSEVLELRLDLEKLPEWYIDQIVYRADAEVEIVLPFATAEQRKALRSSLKTQGVME